MSGNPIEADSPEVCYLYMLHENKEMTITDKIRNVTEKYDVLGDKEKWDTLKNFFKNPVYVRVAYYCRTYSNFGNGTVSNKYIRSGVSHDESVKGNIYFYILLSMIGGKKAIVAYTNNYFTCSERTERYLDEYGKTNGLIYESGGRESGKYLIRIMHSPVAWADGHTIYRCTELPI